MRTHRIIALLLLTWVAFAEEAPRLLWYHEATCPTVKLRPMVRMTRAAAVSGGLQPAPDCHPELSSVRVTYLGTLDLPAVSSGASGEAKPVHVREYTRRDGTVVREHDRARPGHGDGE